MKSIYLSNEFVPDFRAMNGTVVIHLRFIPRFQLFITAFLCTSETSRRYCCTDEAWMNGWEGRETVCTLGGCFESNGSPACESAWLIGGSAASFIFNSSIRKFTSMQQVDRILPRGGYFILQNLFEFLIFPGELMERKFIYIQLRSMICTSTYMYEYCTIHTYSTEVNPSPSLPTKNKK